MSFLKFYFMKTYNMDALDRNIWIIFIILIILELALIFAYKTLSNKGYFTFSSDSLGSTSNDYAAFAGGTKKPDTSSTKSLWKPKKW